MEPRTIFLNRLIGLYAIVISLAMMARKQSVIATLAAMMDDAPLMLSIAIATVTIGLAIVLTHNVWRGGAAAVIVTLIGWSTLLKGTLLLFLTKESATDLYLRRLHYDQYFYAYLGVFLLLGLYLTYEGFKSAAS